MASNLSALITDAFAIYSEAYVKIAELGSKIVDLHGQPRQPAKINQLIEATMLFDIVSDSISLNDAGTAIKKVVGDISVMNNLLLKLKRSVDLYSLPQFPTPLTVFTFDNDRSGGGGGGGGCTTTESLDTTGAVLTFDLDGSCSKKFLGSADITTQKTWNIINYSAAEQFTFNFVIDATLSESSHDITLPSNVKMSDARIVSSAPKKWRPYEVGEYQARATTYNKGVSWILEISGATS